MMVFGFIGLAIVMSIIILILDFLSGNSKKGRKKGSMRSPKNGKWLW